MARRVTYLRERKKNIQYKALFRYEVCCYYPNSLKIEDSGFIYHLKIIYLMRQMDNGTAKYLIIMLY